MPFRAGRYAKWLGIVLLGAAIAAVDSVPSSTAANQQMVNLPAPPSL